MNPDRVKLASIRSLTFYAGELTTARRTAPVEQLVCEGVPCRRFQPDVVRCTNAGGAGTDVDWTCKAELPERFRFGRVNVGCEGWSKPGDDYVLKGSCQLTYKLVESPRDGDRNKGGDGGGSGGSSSGGKWDVGFIIFVITFLFVLGVILYAALLSWRRDRARRLQSVLPSNWPGGDGPSEHGTDAPPPYTDILPPGPPSSGKPSASGPSSAPPARGWRPGFGTGAGVGAAGAHLWNSGRTGDGNSQRGYDWERERWGNHRRTSPGGFAQPEHHHHHHHHNSNNNRGEGSSGSGGSSGLGRMQTSTGFGGSSVR